MISLYYNEFPSGLDDFFNENLILMTRIKTGNQDICFIKRTQNFINTLLRKRLLVVAFSFLSNSPICKCSCWRCLFGGDVRSMADWEISRDLSPWTLKTQQIRPKLHTSMSEWVICTEELPEFGTMGVWEWGEINWREQRSCHMQMVLPAGRGGGENLRHVPQTALSERSVSTMQWKPGILAESGAGTKCKRATAMS